MKYLKSKSQLAELLANGGAILVIFVDPNQFMPSKLLLNYIFSHGATSKIDPLLFIWNIVDQEIYDRYQVLSFPQVSVLKGKEVLFSAIGYNREKANEAIEILCESAGMGKLVKQLNKGMSRCANGHQMSALQENKESLYVGGCFECNRCGRLCHFEKNKPTLHCGTCTYDICTACSYSDVLV